MRRPRRRRGPRGGGHGLHRGPRKRDAHTFETHEFVARALRAGASGFLGKDVGAEELLAGIRTVASGDALLSPSATRALIARFLAAPEPPT